MTGTALFVPARVPLVDPRTGIVTREWYLLFQSLFAMGSGVDNDLIATIAPDVATDVAAAGLDRLRDDLSLAPAVVPVAPPGDDVSPPAAPPLFFAAGDVLPVINGLRDEIAMLRARIDDMAKGGPIL